MVPPALENKCLDFSECPGQRNLNVDGRGEGRRWRDGWALRSFLSHKWVISSCPPNLWFHFLLRFWHDKRYLWDGLLQKRREGSAASSLDVSRVAERWRVHYNVWCLVWEYITNRPAVYSTCVNLPEPWGHGNYPKNVYIVCVSVCVDILYTACFLSCIFISLCEHAFPTLYPHSAIKASETLKIFWSQAAFLEIPLPVTGEHRKKINLFSSGTFLCHLVVKSQLTVLPHFSTNNVEKFKCLLDLLQVFVFVSQLKMSHGSVPKSGLKLLQMFLNDRLQFQQKPTSTFAYYIFLFEVTQMKFM